MLMYLSAVWSGMEDPFWPHAILVPLSVVAGIAVGAGIIFERPRYPPAVHRIAFWRVVAGVAVESLCTVSLFVVDERISLAQGEVIKAQKDKIIELEAALAPRSLSPAQQGDISNAVKAFPGTPFDFGVSGSQEGIDVMVQIASALTSAGWVWVDTPMTPRLDAVDGHFVSLVANRGIRVQIAEEKAGDWENAAVALLGALRGAGLLASAGIVRAGKEQTNAVHIHIGDKR